MAPLLGHRTFCRDMTPNTWTSPHGRILPRVGARTLVMAVLNVTPDSFSDGGRFVSPEAAAEVALKLAGEGADVIDIGGESTRPGHETVTAEEELRRVLPVIAAIRERSPTLPISIDTSKATVAEAAVAAGADLINDVCGLTAGIDPAVWTAARKAVGAGAAPPQLPISPLAAVAARHGCPLIAMHPSAPLRIHDFWTEIIADLRLCLALAEQAGVEPRQIWVDPGFGFGKTVAENLELVKNLGRLSVLGRPILLGTSRKSTIGRVLDRTVDQRLEGTAATVVWGIAQGCAMVRVHDVAALQPTLRMADAVARGLTYAPAT
jgi:dihydropteroate synthase